MSDGTLTIYFNYNLLDCMDNAVYSSLDLSVKLETFSFEQRCQTSISLNLYDTKKPFDFSK